MNLMALFNSPKKDDYFNSHPDGVFVIAPDGKILDLNLKIVEIFGFSRFDMIGQFFSQYVQGGSTLLNKIVAQGKPSVSKATVASNDEKYVEVSAFQNKETQKVYVAIRDVTQSYKMQNLVNGEFEIAKKIIDEKNTYLSHVSDDFTSAIESIEGFSKALLEGIGGPLVPKQAKYVSIINKNSADLQFDLENMFKFFELESNLVEYDYKNFDFVNLLNGIVKKYEDRFKSKGLAFSHDFTGLASRNCCLDQNVIESLFTILLEALMRTSDVGTCTFYAGNPPLDFLQKYSFEAASEEDVKNYAMFELKDTSSFLTDEELENIFNPYYFSHTIPKKSVGVKFAFPVIRKYLKNMRGDMWIYSKAGQGTMYSFVIPLEKIV